MQAWVGDDAPPCGQVVGAEPLRRLLCANRDGFVAYDSTIIDTIERNLANTLTAMK